MILFKQMELLKQIHKLIDAENTGTPKSFAKRLGISERRLYGIIDEMKDAGAPIEYSRKTGNYYYSKNTQVSIVCSFRCLSDNELGDISAGCSLFFSFLFTDCFVQ